MQELTINDKKAVLAILKDYSEHSTAKSVSQKLNISQWGAQKLLKGLAQSNILQPQKIANAIIYTINFESDYVKTLLIYVLTEQAQEYKRWQKEFEICKPYVECLLLFGSIVHDYKKANDIDIIVVLKEKNISKLESIFKELQLLSHKPYHLLYMTLDDFKKNIREKNPVIKNAFSNAIVLFGQQPFIEVCKDVAQHK